VSQFQAQAQTKQISETKWDPDDYERTARFVSDLGEPVLRLLGARAGDRILDLGCGDGPLTKRIAETGAKVVGVDPSAEFVWAAKALGLDARVMAGEDLNFDAEFDAVFSNAAIHWIRGQDEMIDGVQCALKPGGRFVAEFGGKGNVERVRAVLIAALARRGIDALPLDPWYFPSDHEYRARLERHGFRVTDIHLMERPTKLPRSLGDWLGTFAQSFLAPLGEEERTEVKAEVERDLAPVLKNNDGVWSVDYVRLRFSATRA
jgi:trans-aconitate methyltransferase